MSCLRTFCEDFLRLVSLGYLAAGLVLIWTVSVLVDLRKPVTLLRLREFWYPDVVGGFGFILTLLGSVATVGAWGTRTGPIGWFAGASFTLLLIEVACALIFSYDRTAFDAASKHDQTQGLAAALGWIADNLTVFNVLLYIALITQALGVVAATCYAACCGRGRGPRGRYRRGYEYAVDNDPYTPLLPQSRPSANSSYRTPRSGRLPSSLQDSPSDLYGRTCR